MRIIALDRGKKNIWLARCNNLGVPLPLWYIENNSTIFFELSSIITQYKIDTILYGYPTWNPKISSSIDKFISNLQLSVDSSIHFIKIDEHYSSVEAADRTGDVWQKHISQDTVSAMVLIERYMENIANSTQ